METKTVVKYVKFTNWMVRESVETLGDITGMVEQPVINTILSGRKAVVREWLDESTGNGYEEITHYLHEWE